MSRALTIREKYIKWANAAKVVYEDMEGVPRGAVTFADHPNARLVEAEARNIKVLVEAFAHLFGETESTSAPSRAEEGGGAMNEVDREIRAIDEATEIAKESKAEELLPLGHEFEPQTV